MDAAIDSPTHVNGLHVIDDKAANLHGVIAIDSLTLGPAMGGCRFWRYETDDHLAQDAVRLAKGMSYKNALAGLPLGGGKSVLQDLAGEYDRAALFRAFGEAIESLQGRYVTAEDVGTTVEDIRPAPCSRRGVRIGATPIAD